MKELRLGAEYGASPMFDPNVEQMGHIAPSELGLPRSLIMDIEAWNQDFQSTYCDDYPPESGFSSPEQVCQHNCRGLELTRRIQEVLGSDWTIKFIPLSVPETRSTTDC